MVENYNLTDLTQLGDLASFLEDFKETLNSGDNYFSVDLLVKNYFEIYQA